MHNELDDDQAARVRPARGVVSGKLVRGAWAADGYPNQITPGNTLRLESSRPLKCDEFEMHLNSAKCEFVRLPHLQMLHPFRFSVLSHLRVPPLDNGVSRYLADHGQGINPGTNQDQEWRGHERE